MGCGGLVATVAELRKGEWVGERTCVNGVVTMEIKGEMCVVPDGVAADYAETELGCSI